MNIELNITMHCNIRCTNCNRMCNLYPDRTEHMTVAQIEKFVQHAKDIGGIKRAKVVGGEPLVHPDFKEIYTVLGEATEQRIISYVKIDTNKTIPIPSLKPYQFVRWSGKHPKKKAHLPILWSPKDLGYHTSGPCQQISKCGFSLDKYGYLPCSLAIMITRLFGLTHLYRQEIPKQPWGLEELCPLCIFSMDSEFRHKWWTPLGKITTEEKTPTKSYDEALKKFNVEEFYKTQKEF